MEAYRSGHNGPHSKCGYRLKRYKGSNPFASAIQRLACESQMKRNASVAFLFSFSSFVLSRFVFVAIGTVRNNVALRFPPLTLVLLGTNPLLSAKLNLNRMLRFGFFFVSFRHGTAMHHRHASLQSCQFPLIFPNDL